MTKKKDAPKMRKHHWLASYRARFIVDGEPEGGSFEHNITLTNDRQFVTANMIGQGQQAVQLALFSQFPNPKMKIIDCHVQSVSYLGCMSQDEFYTPPPAEEAAPAGESAEPAVNDPFALKGPTVN